jgi:hypothetical protein
MRVLFYGGCHATALRELFKWSAVGSHQFSSLLNYELINSGTPFPYDTLPSYDWVVFSPVRNKGEWNTDLLKARCDELRIPTVSFPWLQWNGYFPDVGDADRPPHRWTYKRLVQMAKAGATLADIRSVALDPNGLDPLGYPEYATSTLESHEGGLDICISEFIRANFRERRLFWTPDHPTLVLYGFVQTQIAERLGLMLNVFARHEEPHADMLTILPGVVSALGLRFQGEEYRLESWRQGIGLEAFLALTLKLFGERQAAG